MNAHEPSTQNRLINEPLDTFRAAVQTVVDLLDFIRDNADRIQNIEEAFVREARRSHSEHLEEQHRKAAKLYHDHVHAVVDLRKDADGGDISELTEKHQADLKSAIFALTGHERDYWHYWQIWQDLQKRPQELYLLTKALFISLVSDFEVLVASVVKVQLQLRPEILNISEQKYSLADMKDFRTLDDFKNHCAEVFADSLMRGGFDEWMKWFSSRHKLAIPGVTVDNDVLVEVFQRRHLLVHAGGVVNDQYLLRCGDEVTKGTELKVGRRYMLRSADVLLASGIKLMGTAGLAVADSDTKKFLGHSFSRHLAYDLLKARRYAVAKEVLEWYSPKIEDEADRLTSQVNLWIAMKYNDGSIDGFRDEIEAWDTSVLADRFKLAKHALLGEDVEAYALVSKLISAGDITIQDWNEWPLLQSVRRYESESSLGPLSQSLSAVIGTHADAPDEQAAEERPAPGNALRGEDGQRETPDEPSTS